MLRRLRSEGGFGLVELLIAMTVLSVAIMAIVAGFTSGTTALIRAARVGTGSTLADKQMELYRGLAYDSIKLGVWVPDSTYSGDEAYALLQVTDPLCMTAPQCSPSQTVTGPDNRAYRIDTYIVPWEPSGPGGDAREVKKVTVVVRDVGDANKTLARQISTFDALSG